MITETDYVKTCLQVSSKRFGLKMRNRPLALSWFQLVQLYLLVVVQFPGFCARIQRVAQEPRGQNRQRPETPMEGWLPLWGHCVLVEERHLGEKCLVPAAQSLKLHLLFKASHKLLVCPLRPRVLREEQLGGTRSRRDSLHCSGQQGSSRPSRGPAAFGKRPEPLALLGGEPLGSAEALGTLSFLFLDP